MTPGLILLLLCATVEKTRTEKGTQLSESKVVSTIEIPEIYPQGVVLVKDQLWVINSKEKTLLKIDVKTKRIVDVVKTPLTSPRGLAWDGKYFWYADNKNKMVHQIDPSDGKIVRSLKVPVYEEKLSVVLEAVAWDGKHLWIAIGAGWSSLICRMDATTGEVIQSMFANCYPRGLATDGKYLWVVSYNQGKYPGVVSRRTIMKDSKKMNLSRIFLCRTQGKEPTGIAFDGKYLWVADKEMQSLQRIELPSER
jgi:DNA-binding beta-propeller fold protein YncE